MSTIKFVMHNASGGEEFDGRPKRAKHACLPCQTRKVKCSGTHPCDLCLAKKIECTFKETKYGSNGVGRRSSGAGTSTANNITDTANSITTKQIKPRKIQQQPAFINPTSDANAISALSALSAISATSPATSSSSNKRKRSYTVQTTRQPYFRWLGPTAIAPPKAGTFRLLSVNLKSDSVLGSRKSSVVIERQNLGPVNNNNNSNQPELHDAKSPMSSVSDREVYPPLPSENLYRNFLDNMSNYMPYLPADGFEERFSQGVLSECFLYAIASLAERLTPNSIAAASQLQSSNNGSDHALPTPSLADRYAEAAKRLILPHLASPSVEIVFTLLLLAYNEFGEDRDSGLWSWSGLAIRMCYDLGLHKKQSKSDIVEDTFGKKVFWSVVCLDRIISCGTGRYTSIPDKDIEHEPELGTLNNGQRTDPFPYLCRLFMLLGKVSNYLNTYANRNGNKPVSFKESSVSPSSLSPESWDMMEAFAQFQQQVSDFYSTLPPDLLFDVQNFQAFSKLKYSQVFLLLHVWNQALVLAVHHPTIVYPKCQLDVMGLMLNPHAEATGTGAISIADMAAFADLIEPNSFLANPFLSQPIYMAACASLTLWHSLPSSSQSHSQYTLQRTYNTCRQILGRMQKIWRGISWHSRTLDSLAASEPDVDLSVNPKGSVFTKDLGVVRKASIDEATRKWIVGEMEDKADDIYGLFIAGTTDGNWEKESADLISQDSSTGSQVRVSMINRSGGNDELPEEEDTFRSLVLRNMELAEFLAPDAKLGNGIYS